MGYKVIRVSTRKELNDFLNLPFKIYRQDGYWVAPIKSEIKRTLNSEKNPYFKNASIALFNCYFNSEIRARTSVVVNKVFCKKASKEIAFFGFFESFNESEAVKFLFDEVFKYCEDIGIEKIEGPFNPNHYSELGIQFNEFNTFPSFFQTYNPDYYNFLLTNFGFKPEKLIHTRKNKNSSSYFAGKYTDRDKLEVPGFNVRSFNMKNFEKDLENLREIFNDAFSENWHFIPVSKEEYLFSSKHMKYVTPPELIQFVEHEGKPVAAVHFVLDINPALKKLYGKTGVIKYLHFINEIKKTNNVIIFAVGIKKAFRNSKVINFLFNATVNTAKRFNSLETTWIYEDNKIITSLAEKLGLKKDKEFIIYSKNLHNI